MDMCVCAHVGVCKQNPSEQGAMAWNWREPTGRVSPWCSPPPRSPSPPSFPPGSGVTVRWAAAGGGGTEPCEWGDEQSCGPLCQPQTRIRELAWDSLRGWAKGRREKAAVRCFSLTSPPAHLCFFFFILSVVFSEAVISFCHALFFGWACL